MTSRVRTRFSIQLTLAIASALAVVLTLAWPDWIEAVFNVDPDGGSGAAELAVVTGCGLATIGFGMLSRRTWHRATVSATSGS